MNRKKLAIPLLVMVMVSMACSFGYEGINFGSDEEIEHIEDLTATAANQESQLTGPISTPEPTSRPIVRATSVPEAAAEPETAPAEVASGGPKEYSVSAQDFDCVCQVNGNVTTELIFKGDQLEIPNEQGGAVYEKIGEDTYKRTWMGYYILVSGEGENRTETKVDEERSAVIILTDNGYVMEHYQGTSGSPCCIHTFTQTK